MFFDLHLVDKKVNLHQLINLSVCIFWKSVIQDDLHLSSDPDHHSSLPSKSERFQYLWMPIADLMMCVCVSFKNPFLEKKIFDLGKVTCIIIIILWKRGGGGSFFLLEMKPSMYIRFWIEGTWIAVEKRNHVSFEVVTIRELVRYKVKKRAEADWKRHWRERVYICVTLKVSHWFYDGCLVWFGNEIVLFSISFFLGRTQDKTIDISECA